MCSFHRFKCFLTLFKASRSLRRLLLKNLSILEKSFKKDPVIYISTNSDILYEPIIHGRQLNLKIGYFGVHQAEIFINHYNHSIIRKIAGFIYQANNLMKQLSNKNKLGMLSKITFQDIVSDHSDFTEFKELINNLPENLKILKF